MKRRVATLLMVFALSAGGLLPAVTRASPDEDKLATNLPSSERPHIAESSGASLLDLSLFGIIALGVLGLFWIRRHTSEL